VGRRRRDVGRGRSLCSSNMDSSTWNCVPRIQVLWGSWIERKC
jgi:hypothetical protein